MPIFEYQCTACGEKTERILAAPPGEITCPKCGAAAQRRVSVFASSTQGSGGCGAPGGSGFS